MKEDGDDEKREVFFFLNQSQIPRLAQERNTWLKMGDMYVARCRSRRQVVDGELHQALAQCVCVEEGMGWGGMWIFTGNLSATDQSERSRATMPPFSDA